LNRQFRRRSSTSLRRLSIVRLSCRPAPGFPRSRVLRLCRRSATDLRRPPIVRRCQRPTSNFRRTLHSPASPSDSRLPACALVCIFRLSFGISFQLAPSASSSSFPSNQPQLFVEPCIFQLYLPTAPPACAGSLSSVFAFGPFVPARAEPLVLRLRFGINLRLAPHVASISSAFQYTSDSSSDIQVSNFASIDLRLAPYLDLPLCHPTNFRLTSAFYRPAFPLD